MTKKNTPQTLKKTTAARKQQVVKTHKQPLPLTEREREVLQGAAQGEGLKQTAAKLNITEKTVENHRSNIFRKLQVANISQAVSEGHKRGIIE